MRNEEYFYGDSETLMFTHTWGTMCNLKCSFCLNEGDFNLNDDLTKEYNYLITDIFAELSHSIDRKLLFVEHGGELLFCDYFHELFEYKVNNIKYYRALFFTNGTSFEKYCDFIDKFEDYVEPFLSFHPSFLNDSHENNFIQCLEYTIKKFGYCNISFVYYEDLDFDVFSSMFENCLSGYRDSIKVKVFFDKNLLEKKSNARGLLKSYKFMTYLDDNGYVYKKLLSDDFHKDFKSKSTFPLKKEQREHVISKYMAAIEIVDDKISYIDFLKDDHVYDDVDKLRTKIFDSSCNIKHSDINTECSSIINQLVEIL